MQETLKKTNRGTIESVERTVTLHIRSKLIVLNGGWYWDMQTEAVYASDVMSFPADFEGAKGIIHPDDLSGLLAAIELLAEAEIGRLDFRLITTWGEVKTISGTNVSMEKPLPQDETAEVEKLAPWAEALEYFALRREAEYLHQRKELAETTDKLYRIGSWAINKTTGEAWYSDGVYRIYDLPPQSLNAHANTFNPFLHPEDRMSVLEVMEKAFEEEVPLHLEYRIVLANGDARYVRQVTQWTYNEKGQGLFFGILRDLTEDQQLVEQTQAAEASLRLTQQMLRFSEQHWNTGYWFLNLVTRKITYSDNYYRIYGLKQQNLPNYNAFINLVHPDDRERMREEVERMYREHVLPESEFRVVRPDGKQRYLKQFGKVFIGSNSELVMVGIVQDITVPKGLEKKIQELNEKAGLQEIISGITETVSETVSLVWHPDGFVTWSEGIYKLLGYRPDSIEPTQRLLHKQIHPDDLKSFRDAELLVMNGQQHDGLLFRIVNKGGLRQLKITFHRVNLGTTERVVGMIKDITKDQILHTRLSETVGFSDLLTKTTSDIIILTDKENTVISWNAVAEAKTGIRSEEALYTNLFDLFPALQEETYLKRLQAVMEGAEIKELKARHSYLKKAHHFNLVPLKNEEGEVTHVLHVVQDVSRELELQQQLGERLAFIESLVEASVDRIVVLDKHMNYIYWNKKAEEYYAISKQRVLNRNILEVFPGFRNDPSYAEFRKVLKGETIYIKASHQQDSEEYFETYLIPVKNEDEDVSAILWIVHDLTKEYQMQREQYKAQQQLAEEHRRLKEAQAIGHVGSFEWDVSSNTIFWSDEMYRIHGLEPQTVDISIDKVLSFIHPADLETSSEKLMQCRREACSISIIHRIVRADGEERIVSRQLQSFADESGRVTHLSGSVQDITEQKKAEEQIRQKTHYLQRIQETVPDMISVTELATMKFDYLNRETFYAHGFDPDKMQVESVERVEIIHSDDRLVLADYFSKFKFASDEDIITAEYRAKDNKDNWKWFLVRGRAFQRNEAGDVTHVLNVIENITERKKAEADAEGKQKLLHATMDSSTNMIQVFQAVRNDEGNIVDFRYVLVNHEAEKWMPNAIGESLLQRQPGVVEEGIFDAFRQVVETGVPQQYEKRYVHEQFDGWFHQSVIKLDDGVATTTADITDRKKAEQELLRLKDEATQKATDKYYSIFNSIDEGFCIFELLYNEEGKAVDWRFNEVNPSFTRQTGLNDVIGKTGRELAVNSEPFWVEVYDTVLQTGEASHFEEYHAETGRWYDVYASRVGDGSNRLVATIFNDITERKQREAQQQFLIKFSDALRAEPDADAIANRALQMLAEHLQLDRCYVGIALLAENRGIFPYQFGNERVQPMPDGGVRLSDFPDALRKTFDETLVITDFQATKGLTETEKQNFAALGFGALVVANVRKEVRKPDWSINAVSATPRHWTRLEIQLIEEVSERTWAAIERAKADEALRNSEEKYRTLFSAIDEGFQLYEVICDDAGKPVDFRYLETNPAFEQQTGLKNVAGKLGSEVIPNLEKYWYDYFDEILQSSEPLHTENYNEATGRWYTISSFRVLNNGRPLIAALFSDITERRQQEQQKEYLLKLNDALRSASTPVAIEETVTRTAIEYFNADRCYYCDIKDGNAITLRDAARKDLPSVAGTYRLDDFPILKKVIEDGKPFTVTNVHTTDKVDEAMRSLCIQLQVISFLNVPVVKEETVVGVLCLVQSEPRNWTDSEVALAIETAERTWDAVERGKAEAALRESEEQLRRISVSLEQQVEERAKALQESIAFVEEITQTTPDRITIHDALTTDILYTNHPDFWKELYANNDIYQSAAAQRAIGLVHPDDEEKFRTFLQQRNNLADREVSEIELRMRGDKWVHIRSKVFKRDEQGTATQIISFTTDITEQKKVEQEVKKNLAILQHTEELAHIGSWEYEIASGKFSWSEGMYQIFGLPRQMHVRPETYLEFVVDEDRSIAKSIVNNLKKNHLAFEETMRIKKAGDERLLHIKASVVNDESGAPQKMIGVDIDLTDIYLAEEKIKETQHWLKQTALASPDAITVYDIQKKQPVYLNDCLARWTGKSLEELVAIGIEGRLQLIDPEDRLPLLHFNERMMSAIEGQILTIEYRIQAKKEETKWIRNRSKVFLRDEEGRVTHILSILQDITAEKAADRLLKSLNTSLEKQNRELEAKNEEITSFAFVASHDLREPIRKIHTFSDWLLEREKNLSEAGQQNLQRLQSSVKLLETLVEDIVALTKVHFEKEDLEEVNLNNVLQKMKQEMQEQIDRTGTQIFSEHLPTVKGVENHLVYLFRNLVGNSIKFQPPGQQPVIEIKSTITKNSVNIIFADNGIGFANEYGKKIFQMFRRLHGKNEYEGTGMGLAICKRVMEKHSGSITAQSGTGKGAVFTCSFPLVSSQ